MAPWNRASPCFDPVAEAQAQIQADLSLMFVPPSVAEGAVDEALHAGIRKLVLITEGIPVHATMRIRARVEAVGARLVGPATPGVISPGQCKVGIMPARFFDPGASRRRVPVGHPQL